LNTLVRWPYLALLVGVFACSSASSASDPSAAPVSPTFGTGDGGASKEGGAIEECAAETKDIFLLTDQNLLYSFHPPTLAFKSIGILKCPTGGATPTSMAVDRQGIAWIRHSDASIWKVNTRDLACQGTTFEAPGDGESFNKFGMGFASTSKGSSNELLFLSDNAGGGLARLDTRTSKMSFVGAYSGALEGKTSELTGTGDGKLYGFFVTAPAQIAEISKGTGEILSTKELANVFAGNAWAFSFYAGDFYI